MTSHTPPPDEPSALELHRRYLKGDDLPDFRVCNRPLSWWEQLYLGPISHGMWLTFSHFAANFFGSRRTVTLEYPEQRHRVSDRWRGRHRLTRRQPSGQLTCVACKMCEMACPSGCIVIEAEELDPPLVTNRQRIDKRPRRFDIDMACCIYCGLCVEACPEDAIRMDSGIIATVGPTRESVILHIEDLSDPTTPAHELLHLDLNSPPDWLLPQIRDRWPDRKP